MSICGSLESVLSDSSWFHRLLEERSGTSTVIDGSDYMVNHHTPLFLDRYFEAAYIPDVSGKKCHDVCVLRHSNGLCLMGLAPGHVLFKGCLTTNNWDGQDLLPHNILGLSFQVTEKTNRLANQVRGKRKRGGQIMGMPSDCIAYAVCDRGERHRLCCGIPGKLIEVNQHLAYRTPSDANYSHTSPPVRIMPLWEGCGDDGIPIFGAHLCIMSLSHRKARQLWNSFKQARDLHNVSPPPKRIAAIDGTVDDSDTMDEDCEIHGERYMSIRDWMAWLAALTNHTVLTWEQYSELRSL